MFNERQRWLQFSRSQFLFHPNGQQFVTCSFNPRSRMSTYLHSKLKLHTEDLQAVSEIVCGMVMTHRALCMSWVTQSFAMLIVWSTPNTYLLFLSLTSGIRKGLSIFLHCLFSLIVYVVLHDQRGIVRLASVWLLFSVVSVSPYIQPLSFTIYRLQWPWPRRFLTQLLLVTFRWDIIR